MSGAETDQDAHETGRDGTTHLSPPNSATRCGAMSQMRSDLLASFASWCKGSGRNRKATSARGKLNANASRIRELARYESGSRPNAVRRRVQAKEPGRFDVRGLTRVVSPRKGLVSQRGPVCQCPPCRRSGWWVARVGVWAGAGGARSGS